MEGLAPSAAVESWDQVQDEEKAKKRDRRAPAGYTLSHARGHDKVPAKMTQTTAVTQALAVDIRQAATDDLMGVALIVASERHVSWLSAETGAISAPALSDEVWRDVDAWDQAAAARLPFKPEAMTGSIVDALLGGAARSAMRDVIARRFAAIPITIESRDALTELLDRLLPGLLNSRRAA
jgi:hypothetical protein